MTIPTQTLYMDSKTANFYMLTSLLHALVWSLAFIVTAKDLAHVYDGFLEQPDGEPTSGLVMPEP